MLSFRSIVCGLDFSDGSARALVRAADLAERAHADLHLVHADPTFRARLAQVPGGDIHAPFLRRLRGYVNETLGADDAYDVLAPEAHIAHGEAAADAVLRHAERVDADLIVLGTHARKGLGHLLLGSVAADVLRASTRPVLVVPEVADEHAFGTDRPVLVAVDFSPHTPLAIRFASDLAAAYGAPVELVHVLEGTPETTVDFGGLFTAADLRSSPSEGARALAEKGLERLQRHAAAARVHVATGVAETEIVRLAEERRAGAIVMGTHGRTGFDRVLLGSVAEWTLRHAPCPVLALPTACLQTRAEPRVSRSAA